MNETVSIVVLTYNRPDSLRETLAQMQRDLAGAANECIVVDNSTDSRTRDLVRTTFPAVRYIKNERNVGVAARNNGVRAAQGSVVITLDDDILGLTAADVEHVKRRFADDRRLGALNFRVVQYYSGRTCNWVHHRPIADAPGRFVTYEITEGAVAFRRDVFLEAGCYCEEFFISHEGPDLAFRIMNIGFAVEYDGGIAVRHKHEAAGREDWRFYYYDTRNQFYLAVRNMPFGYGLRYLLWGQAAMAVYSLRDRHFLAWLRGAVDGLRRCRQIATARRPWTDATARAVRAVDACRPSAWHMIKVRLLQRKNRMEA